MRVLLCGLPSVIAAAGVNPSPKMPNALSESLPVACSTRMTVIKAKIASSQWLTFRPTLALAVPGPFSDSVTCLASAVCCGHRSLLPPQRVLRTALPSDPALPRKGAHLSFSGVI